MSVIANKELLCINQIIGQKIDTAVVEEDFVVPDIKPDILNSISTSGTLCVHKKEVMDGKIKIDASINAYIIYLADDEDSNVRSMNVSMDFSQMVDFDKVKSEMILEDNIVLKTIECKVLNGRKISLKAIVDMDLKVFSNENMEFVNQIEDLEDVQMLNENISLNSLLGNGMTKVYAKDTFMLDGIDNLAEIMKVNIDIKNKETKISYNKVLIKADACVKIMYLTDDNRICTISNLIPVMGFIDAPNVTDDNICDVKYQIKNILIKPNNSEEHSIYVEIELEVNCNVYETKQIDIIQDLYSPSIDLIYKQKMIKAISQKCVTKDICPIKEKQFISEIGNNKIYDVDICPIITNKTILKDRIVFEGELQTKFIFEDNNSSRINTKNIAIPFNYNMDCSGINQNSNCETQIEIVNQDCVVMPDESVEIKVDIEFIINMSNMKDINVIEDIEAEENRDNERYSIIIYFVKPDDTLWQIAKRFKSTIQNIVNINQIENPDRISVGQQLFIPVS